MYHSDQFFLETKTLFLLPFLSRVPVFLLLRVTAMSQDLKSQVSQVSQVIAGISSVTLVSDLIHYIWGNKMEELSISSVKLALYSLF